MSTQITNIVAPSKAAQGAKVDIGVYVKNVGTSGLYMAVTSDKLAFLPDYRWAEMGTILPFWGNFTMPTSKWTATITSWWWNGSVWVKGDSRVITIDVQAAAQAEFKDLIGSFSAQFY